MRLRGTKLSSIAQSGGLGNQLWDLASSRPSLDLQFADTKSLVDATTGQNLVTFSRASGGTYVDSQGVIRNAVTNLLLRSEEFDNASWLLTGILAFGSGSIANAATAPNGTTTAEKLVEASGGTTHFASQQVTISSGTVYTLSVYAKAAERSRVALYFGGAGGAAQGIIVNLTNGTFAANIVAAPTSYSITPAGNGWYRISITATSVGTAANHAVYICNDSNAFSYSGDGTSGLYLWGAQLEQSSTVGEYIPTTSTINSAPRFDHNPSTGESLGLLVEEARTNLLLNTSWSGAVAGSPGTAPTNWTIGFGTGAQTSLVSSAYGTVDGAQAVKFDADATERIMYQQSVSVTSGVQYAVSVYIEAVTGSIGDAMTITAGTATATQNTFVTSPSTPGRHTILVTANTTGTINLRFGIGTTAPVSGTCSVIMSRPQVEAGAFPTSYIKTEAATATRAADVASISGSNLTSWFNASFGTMFCGTSALRNASGVIYGFGDTFDNTLYVTPGSSNNVFVRSGGALAAVLTAPVSTSSVSRSAVAYQLDNFAAVSDGGTVSTDSSGAAPVSPVRFKLGSSAWDAGASNIPNGHISRLTYWPTRLSNAVLQSITQ